jgi:hypothetical protein
VQVLFAERRFSARRAGIEKEKRGNPTNPKKKNKGKNVLLRRLGTI